MTFACLGDSAVVVTLGAGIDESTLHRVRTLAAAIEHDRAPGILDVVPAYASVTVFYDIVAFSGNGKTPFERVCQLIRERTERIEGGWTGLLRLGKNDSAPEAARTVEIPVCYGDEFGEDLDGVAQHCKLTPKEVVALHSGGDYIVHAIGFAPGFCYLGGLPEALHTPRRPTPRPSVVPGSVGIGWQQTGVYPLATPGGWQLIGRTPLTMFRAERSPASLLRVGDAVKFREITKKEFAAWK
jgi:inhibitor of KinA